MTDPLVELESARLQVNPGGQVSVRVTVRNVGHIIEGFRLDVLGVEVGPWAEVSPAELRVDVDQEASAVVIFTPPTGTATPTGSFAFGVKVTSLVDPSSSAVVEGDIEVGRVFGLTSKITPVTSNGRWRGHHRVEFSNWGNAPVQLRLSAHDPDEKLGFLVAPEALTVPLGGTVQAHVKVRTRKPFLRGNPVRLPFQVVADPYEGGPPRQQQPGSTQPQQQTLDGALLQKPIIAKAIVKAAGAVVGMAVAVAAFVIIGMHLPGKGGTTNASDGTPTSTSSTDTTSATSPSTSEGASTGGASTGGASTPNASSPTSGGGGNQNTATAPGPSDYLIAVANFDGTLTAAVSSYLQNMTTNAAYAGLVANTNYRPGAFLETAATPPFYWIYAAFGPDPSAMSAFCATSLQTAFPGLSCSGAIFQPPH